MIKIIQSNVFIHPSYLNVWPGWVTEMNIPKLDDAFQVWGFESLLRADVNHGLKVNGLKDLQSSNSCIGEG